MSMKKVKIEQLLDGFYYAEIVNVEAVGQSRINSQSMPVGVITYRLHETSVEIQQRYVMMLNYENKLREVFASVYGRVPLNATLSALRGANLIVKLGTNVSSKTGKTFRNVDYTFGLNKEDALIMENEPEDMLIDLTRGDFSANE